MRRVVRLGSLAVLVGYVALSTVYLAPPNPLSMALEPLVNATIGTYFEQNWDLFAPRPVSSDFFLLVRPLTNAEMAAVASKDLPTDGWFDLSSPLWRRLHPDSLGGYGRLINTQNRAIQAYLEDVDRLTGWDARCRSGDSAACTFYAQQLQMARAGPGSLLARLGSAFINEQRKVGKTDAMYFAVRVRETVAPAWSNRYLEPPRLIQTDVGVYPVDESLTPADVYVGLAPG